MKRQPKTPPTAEPRGYVLFIVLVIGVAASLAALSLATTRGAAQIGAVHSERSDAADVLAEAGMSRALFYMTDVLGQYGDFDAALDVDLDSPCDTSGNPIGTKIAETCDTNEDDYNLRPDTVIQGGDTDDIQEWTDGRCEIINGRRYTCVSMNDGRYCVRFEDDDDDGVTTPGWDDYTSNNLDSNADCTSCTSGAGDACCFEGDAASDQYCPGEHNAGERNNLRDRNRAIWMVSVGIYPDVDFDKAKHVTTLRRYYMAPRFPTTAGIRIKGNLDATYFGACSDLSGVEVDGTVIGQGEVCFSGRSTATAYTPGGTFLGHCDNRTSMCTNMGPNVLSSAITIDPAGSPPLNTASVNIPDMPDNWSEANEHIDFDRPCTFWMETGFGGAHSTPGITKHGTIWVWDSEAMRGPWTGSNAVGNGTRCGNFETVAAPNARFPGPPNPDYAPGGGSACSTTTDEDCYMGCWTPMLSTDGTSDTVDWQNMADSLAQIFDGDDVDGAGTDGLPNPADSAGSAYDFASFKCFHPWWRRADGDCGWSGGAPCYGTTPTGPPDGCSGFCGSPVGAWEDNDLLFERPRGSGRCDWYPVEAEGYYQVCDPSVPQDCYFYGNATGLATDAPQTSGTVKDPLNEHLTSLGYNTFPALTWLRKPDLEEECFVPYPSPFSGLGAPTNWRANLGYNSPSSSDAPWIEGTRRAMHGKDNGSTPHLWIKPQNDNDVAAVPAGVYVITTGVTPTGASSSFGPVTKPAGLLAAGFSDFPLTTMYTFDQTTLQKGGDPFYYGVGQAHPGAGNQSYDSDWAKYPSWITSATIKFNGAPKAVYAGSLYSGGGGLGYEWAGGGEMVVFGLLFSDGDMKIGGSGEFHWLYQVQLLEELVGGFSGVNPTQSWIAQ